MGNNQRITPQPNKRVFLINPNNFDYQYNGSMFSDNNYNMSVPTEELSILVELKTTSKSRTVLITDSKNVKINDEGSGVVSFINGKKDQTTGGKNFLTTSYTDIGTEKIVEECLGITSIDIEFNSSYAPMIAINFVDVKGGALFQSGAKSIYNVLFKLPYPLFELKVKGFYGKPVTYCLHMVKCNTRFNSQTGNFEITANFVGYTYAMFSDMIVGYLRAATRMKEGADKLATKGTISINDYMRKMSQVNTGISNSLNNTSDFDTNNYAIIKELKEKDLPEIISLIDAVVVNLNDPSKSEPTIGATPDEYAKSIVYIKDPNPSSTETFDNTKGQNLITDFYNEYIKKVDAYNTKCGSLTNLKIDKNILYTNTVLKTKNLQAGPTNSTMREHIVNQYKSIIDVTDDNKVTEAINTLKKASPASLSNNDDYIKIYDFTYIRKHLENVNAQLEIEEKNAGLVLARKTEQVITSELGFQSNIRNTFKMLTAHVEVFLELLYDVSAKYKTEARLTEFEKFKPDNKTERLDIKDSDLKDKNVYPWPEYIVNDEEKYLGEQGVLNNPLNVPEIKFVEDLYAAMVQNIKEDEINKQNLNGTPSWVSFTPSDSIYFTENKTPYDRLPDSANHNDVARLILLRAMGLLSFSNGYLSDDEIKKFASAEAQAVSQKYSITNNTNNIISLLKTSYSTVDAFTKIQGTVKSTTTNVLENFTQDNESFWRYVYIDSGTFTTPSKDTFSLKFLPIDKGFTDITQTWEPTFSDKKLSTRISSLSYTGDGSNYIDFSTDYLTKQSNGSNSPAFKYTALKETINSAEKATNAGFSVSSGKYGVQEFTQLDWGGDSSYAASTLPFYSLFYNNPLRANGWEGFQNGLSSPRTEAETQYDLVNKNGAFKVVTLDEYGTKLNDFFKIYYNHKNCGKNIDLFINAPNRSQVSFPFFGFSLVVDHTFNLTKQESTLVNSVSLFGSWFYNNQDSKEAKAFLFLHCFPWRGLMGQSSIFNNVGILGTTSVDNNVGLFIDNAIKNTFSIRNGFIEVPKLWPIFVGALLWRIQTTEDKKADPIKFKFVNSNGVSYSLISSKYPDNYPTHKQYLKMRPTGKTVAARGFRFPISSLTFNSEENRALIFADSNSPMFFTDASFAEYPQVDNEILNLPPNVKKIFIDKFLNFVNSEYSSITSELEIKPKAGKTWVDAWQALNSSTSSNNNAQSNTLQNVLAHFDFNQNNYSILTYFYNSDALNQRDTLDYNLLSEYKQGSPAEQKLLDLFFSSEYIVNDSSKIFNLNLTGYSYDPYVSNSGLTTYLTTVINGLTESAKAAEEEKMKFDSVENIQIKLEIYRTLKKIYDKWVGGVAGSPRPFNDILFQCCTKGTNESLRLEGDSEMNKKLGGDGKSLNLIDSFRFVSRSFKDIGDDFQINSIIVTNQLYESSDVSIYDLFSRILTENNFDFIPLPNYINFNDPKEISSVFEPIPYYLAEKITNTGPSFVCVYVGQTSTKLDFGKDSQYPNDSFDLTDDKTWPEDFNEDKKPWEDYAAAFVVNYGHQNQNIFKDVRLDQAEFNETAESLQITDMISNQFSRTGQGYVGQNLYNVYSVRSYKVEVEMMGDAMIQPMMYFQLNNIPMFHGAYLITKVNHTIKPNTMSTVFTGTRIRIARTPLVDVDTLYSALLAGTEVASSSSGSVIVTDRSNTKTTEADKKANQLTVFKYLKNKGLSRAQVAGIMGNIFAESRFDPSNVFYDVKSASVGILQFNVEAEGYTKKGLSAGNPAEKALINAGVDEMFKDIGRTAESQINVLFQKPASGRPNKVTDPTYMPRFLKESANSQTADEAAYLFAKHIERCFKCNKSREEYETGGVTYTTDGKKLDLTGNRSPAAERSKPANDFYVRFNDPTDPLYWGETITINIPTNTTNTTITTNAGNNTNVNTNTGTGTAGGIIIIGDSGCPCLETQLSKTANAVKAKLIGKTEGKNNLHQSGKTTKWLAEAVEAYPTSAQVTRVVINIGSNDLYDITSPIGRLMDALVRAFPNAKFIFVKGDWGWGYFPRATPRTGSWSKDVDEFYQKFKTYTATKHPNVSVAVTPTNGGDFTNFKPVGNIKTADAAVHSCNPKIIPNLLSQIQEIEKELYGLVTISSL